MKIPGFIDLQVNGCKGVDFSSSDLTEESFIRACCEIFKKGTAAFLPTIITSPFKVYKQNLPVISKTANQPEFKNKILGIHLEGPFISSKPGAVGAHSPKLVRKPDIKLLDQLWNLSGGKIKMITMAADIKGADKLCQHAVSLGITVSLGHHMALEQNLDRLVSKGAKALTHLGNAVPNNLPRHVNPIWAGLANDNLSAMVIADGHHLPVSILKAVVKIKGAKKIIVVSDSSAVTGLAPGKYTLHGNTAVLERSGLFHNPLKKCLVGSSSNMMQCMNHLASLKLLNPVELIQIGFFNPLKLINIKQESIQSDYFIEFNRSKNKFIKKPYSS